jgi:hypothetical protein
LAGLPGYIGQRNPEAGVASDNIDCTMKVDETTWTKWQEWVRRIEADLSGVLLDKVLFDGFREVCEQNGDWIDAHDGQLFTGLVKRSYAASAFMRIRRQLKAGDQSVSLLRLLKELAAQAHQLTLDRYEELQDEGRGTWEWRRDALEKLSDGQNREVVSKDRVEGDMAEIRRLNEHIEQIADRVIAHHDPRGSDGGASFDDLRTSIDALDRIVHKYIVFLTGSYWSDGTLKPNVSASWKRIFAVPLKKTAT